MRYPPDRKDTTRRKIVDAASKAFRLHGVAGASVADIMADAGLTVGGFYRHFDSKDALFQVALEKAMGETLALMQRRGESGEGSGATGDAWLARAAAIYLSPEHRDMQAAGCPLPGLTGEVSRGSADVRRSFQESLGDLVDAVAQRIDPHDPGAVRPRAWAFLASLVGSLLLARGVEDPSVVEEILGASRQHLP